jgi:hypothetical protein
MRRDEALHDSRHWFSEVFRHRSEERKEQLDELGNRSESVKSKRQRHEAIVEAVNR